MYPNPHIQQKSTEAARRYRRARRPARGKRSETVAALHLMAANFVPVLLGEGFLQMLALTGFTILVGC